MGKGRAGSLPAAADSALITAPASAQPTAAAGSLAGNRGVQPEARIESDARIDAEPAPAQARAQVETPAPAPVVEPAPVGTSGVAQETQVARAGELPRTASPLTLSGLIGLLSLAGAAGIRAIRASRL